MSTAKKRKPFDPPLADSLSGVHIKLEGGEIDRTVRPTRLSPADVRALAGEKVTERSAQMQRQTTETKIDLNIILDGRGQVQINTGIGFFDHMLALLAKHSLIDLKVQAQGDLNVDPHHTVEDVGICLGKALAQALGDKAGIRRYGQCILPMDETLVTAAVDLGGRAFFIWRAEIPREKLGTFDSMLAEDFWQAVANNALMNLHVLCHYGRNTHHMIEGIFKAAARALRQAVEVDPRVQGVPSTKGTLSS